jgi:hypothetical protein
MRADTCAATAQVPNRRQPLLDKPHIFLLIIDSGSYFAQ